MNRDNLVSPLCVFIGTNADDYVRVEQHDPA